MPLTPAERAAHALRVKAPEIADGAVAALYRLRPGLDGRYGDSGRRHYARDLGLFPVEEAVRKMTSLAASRAQLRDRGVIREGMKADIIVFDPETIRDRSTFEEPHQYSEGVEAVIVNGVAVLEGAEMTGARPGRILRGPGWKGE